MFPYLVIGILYVIISLFYLLDTIFAKTLEKENFETYKKYWRAGIFAFIYFLTAIFYIVMYITHRHGGHEIGPLVAEAS